MKDLGQKPEQTRLQTCSLSLAWDTSAFSRCNANGIGIQFGQLINWEVNAEGLGRILLQLHAN